jgi:hypothetical protein
MRKFLKIAGICLLALVAIITIIGMVKHKPKPVGMVGPEAEQMTQAMYAALNKPAWDSTGWVKWQMGKHTFAWDRVREQVRVQWSDYDVLVSTKDQTGKVLRNGNEQSGDDAQDALQKAWSYFCNDSFWFVAPFKATDEGTTRSVVTLKNGNKGLLVQYYAGGVTPGDTYLWELDEHHVPVAYSMWVKIIPIGGLRSTWSSWQALPTGARVAVEHQFSGLKIQIIGVDAGFGLMP